MRSSIVDLLPGSITSVSANGLTIPYGGTTDGVTYSYAGAAVQPIPFISIGSESLGSESIKLSGLAVDVEKGAVLDLSGGGSIVGAGFISGRGGTIAQRH